MEAPQKSKKNACFFCGQMFSKITLHLERIHSDEKEVKQFSSLTKGCLERKKRIETLRKEGNFKYSREKNIVIACRREQKNREGKVNYMVCSNCKGFFSSTSLRHHVRKCTGKQDNCKNISVLSRKIKWDVHPKACAILKEEILPVLRLDEITNLIRYDPFLISYGNRMSVKYRSPHHHTMIRARLRSLGRFLVEMRKRQPDNIINFDDIFDPRFYDDMISSINSVAQLDDRTGKYKAPSTAFNLGILLKYCINMKISQCIKSEEDNKKKRAKDLLKLFTEDVSTSVNKTVTENQSEMRRNKKVTLPINDDIQRLNKYLTEQRRKYHHHLLTDGFSYSRWKELACLVLISIQFFNRRRAGEIERILISDFKNYQTISEETDPEIFKSLSDESRKAASQYGRTVIRGKLGKNVPVLIHRELIVMGSYIVDHRVDAEVNSKNPYVFGIPGGSHKFLRACPLLKKYSERCGAKNPTALRGTELRKHIATQSVLYDLQETEVQDLANFLGHELSIHKNYYRMPIVTRDIAQMSKLLEKAQGCPTTNPSEELGEIKEKNFNTKTTKFNNDFIGVKENYRSSNTDTRISSESADTSIPRDPLSMNDKNIFSSYEYENLKGNTITVRDCCVQLTRIDDTRRTLFPTKNSHSSSAKTLSSQQCTSRAGPSQVSQACLLNIRSSLSEDDQYVGNLEDNNNYKFVHSPQPGPSQVLQASMSNIKLPLSESEEDPYADNSENDKNYVPDSNSDYSDTECSQVTGNTVIKRTPWNTPQKKLARKLMNESGNLPSLSRCQEYIVENSILKERTPQQLKAWINNTMKKANRGMSTPKKSVKRKLTWVTPERHAINAFFGKHIKSGTLPSNHECRKAIEKFPILEKRSVAVVKAKVNNEINRRTRRFNQI